MRSFLIVMAITAAVIVCIAGGIIALLFAASRVPAAANKELYDAQIAEEKRITSKMDESIKAKNYITYDLIMSNKSAATVDQAYNQLSVFVDEKIEREPDLAKAVESKLTKEDLPLLTLLNNLRGDRSLLNDKEITDKLNIYGFEETVDLYRVARFLSNEKVKQIIRSSWKGEILLYKLYFTGIYIDHLVLAS